MKSNLVILSIALVVSLLCGVGFVPSTITGSFNSLYKYTAPPVCGDQRMVLEKESTEVLPGNVYTVNTVYCVDDATGAKRDVTDETYAAFDRLRVKIGWAASALIFVLSLIVLTLAWRKLGASLDKMITNPPTQKK